MTIQPHRHSQPQGALVTPSTTGLFTGLGLGFAGAFGGFDAFAICLLLAAVGLVVGRVLEGQLDLSSLVGSADRRNR